MGLGDYQAKLKNELNSLYNENKRLKSCVEARANKIKHLEQTQMKLEHGIAEMKKKNAALQKSIDSRSSKKSKSNEPEADDDEDEDDEPVIVPDVTLEMD